MARLYSQRMLNPFHGIVNIAEIAGADAVCRDGVNWTLYIQGGVEAAELADGSEAQVPLSDIKFGTWTAHSGLRRAPVRLVTDYDRLDALGCRLLELVKSAADRIPFPLQDAYELWLLDAGPQALPLALLQSCCDPVQEWLAETLRWTAGQRARASFRLEQEGAQPAGAVAADRLTRQVNAAAGPAPATQWFYRQPDGCGRALSCNAADSRLQGRVLPLEAFPELLLRATWADSDHTNLARAYLSWQAPWLLALQGLDAETRRHLERDACKRALLVSELYLTYPEIMDRLALNAARVEARLRLAAGGSRESAGEATTAFFVTGN